MKTRYKQRGLRMKFTNFGEIAKSRNFQFFVIPAQAGIQLYQFFLDARSSPA
jgi:hypothetical protein